MSFSRRFSAFLIASTALLAFQSGANPRDAIVLIDGNTITIRADIEIYGDGATREKAEEIQSTIMKYWAKRPTDGGTWTYFDPERKKTYDVVFDVHVSLYGGKERSHPWIIPGEWDPTNRKNYVNTPTEQVRSNVLGGDEGRWNKSYVGTYAHEFGHLIGLNDRYHDGPDGYSVLDKGWESNLMADSELGQVEQRNIDPIARRIVSEYNHPGRSYWPSGAGATFRTSIDIDDPTD